MRLHGFVRPFHPLQVASWIMFATFNIFYTLIWIPALHGYFTEYYTSSTSSGLVALLSIIYYTLTLVVILTTARATSCNPRDAALSQIPRHEDVHERELRRAQTIADHQWCPYCHTHVHQHSKHCRVCDKCVAGFDHHCKWLNNCVGESNYRLFLGCITSVTCFLLYQMLLGLALFAHSFPHPTYIMSTLHIWYPSITLATFQSLIGLIMFIQLPTMLSITQLLALHIWLIRRGITTYTWIMDNRKKAADKAKIKKNQVAPEEGIKEIEMVTSQAWNEQQTIKHETQKPLTEKPTKQEESSHHHSIDMSQSHLLQQQHRSSMEWGNTMDMDRSQVMANAGVMTLQQLPTCDEIEQAPSFAGAESMIHVANTSTQNHPTLPPISTHRKEWSQSMPLSHVSTSRTHDDGHEEYDRVDSPRARLEPLHHQPSVLSMSTTTRIEMTHSQTGIPYTRGIERSRAQTHSSTTDVSHQHEEDIRDQRSHSVSSPIPDISSHVVTTTHQPRRTHLRDSMHIDRIPHAPHLITSETHSTYHMHHREMSQSYLDSYIDIGRDDTVVNSNDATIATHVETMAASPSGVNATFRESHGWSEGGQERR